MLMNLLRNVFRRETQSCQPQGRRGRGARRASFRPVIEGLEERQLLSVSGLEAACALKPNAFWAATNNGASLTLYDPSIPPAPGSLLNIGGSWSINLPHNITELSAGKTAGGLDAVFVLDSTNTVTEYSRTMSGISKDQQIATGIKQISGSILSADSVFTISTMNQLSEYSHNFRFAMSPPSGAGSLTPTQIFAAKDGTTGHEACFVNFGGMVYEHTGWAASNGWSFVASFIPQTFLQHGMGIFDMSASQSQGDTVFIISGNKVLSSSGDLTEYVGHSAGSGSPLSYSAYSVTSGVSQVCAGVDVYGNATAFTVRNGELDEYTYHLVKGTPPYYYFSKSVVYSPVAVMYDASQIKSDTVLYTPQLQ
jgi:hypothetical protein